MTNTASILSVEVQAEHDLVLARQRTRQLAGLLGLESRDQTRLATAVSEVARHILQHSGRGQVVFQLEGAGRPQRLLVCISSRGLCLADLKAAFMDNDNKGEITGLIGARRLVEHFEMEAAPGQGATVLLGKTLPAGAPPVGRKDLLILMERLAQQGPQSLVEEMQQQNQELVRALGDVRNRQEELLALNRELEDTNRGVVALYAELEERAEHLSRLSEFRAYFLSHMGHELRTPLSSIVALSLILLNRMDGDLAPEQEKQVTFIRQGAQNLLELINDLLDMAKLEAGKIMVQAGDFEVAQLLRALSGMLKPLNVNPDVALVLEDPGNLPPLCTDESKVSQILRNLVANALKYTQKGEVRVSTALAPGGEEIIFTVADTGIGISAPDQERIFEEFVQLDHPLQQQVKGTGLGLALSRKLTHLLGGDISVESQPGRGSTFRVALPVVFPGEALLSAPAVPVAPSPPPPLTVLVVEDDPGMLGIYKDCLRDSGFQMIPAHTIREARKVLQRRRPAAVVLDILMPDESGWLFLAELKDDERTRDIPVVVVTILDEEEKGLMLGAEAYCVKPLKRRWLLAQLQQLIEPVKILIIDDEEAARYAFRRLLADTPYTVLEAASGPEGLRRARQNKPGLIFLDLVMPKMSGLEVLQRLKADPRTRPIPVVIYTSKELSEADRSRLSRDSAAICRKQSATRADLVAQIRETLRKFKQFP